MFLYLGLIFENVLVHVGKPSRHSGQHESQTHRIGPGVDLQILRLEVGEVASSCHIATPVLGEARDPSDLVEAVHALHPDGALGRGPRLRRNVRAPSVKVVPVSSAELDLSFLWLQVY